MLGIFLPPTLQTVKAKGILTSVTGVMRHENDQLADRAKHRIEKQ